MHDLVELLRRLHNANVEFVIVGGFASVLHGVTLVTQDIDICCRFTEGNLCKLQSALSGLHPAHRMTPKKLPLELTAELCARLQNLYLVTDAGTLDCLSEVLGVGKYEDVAKESVVVELPFGECRVLNIDALIRAKEAMNRPHDRITVAQLRAIKEKPIQK